MGKQIGWRTDRQSGRFRQQVTMQVTDTQRKHTNFNKCTDWGKDQVSPGMGGEATGIRCVSGMGNTGDCNRWASEIVERKKRPGTSGGQMENGRSGKLKGRAWLEKREEKLETGAEGNWEADCDTPSFEACWPYIHQVAVSMTPNEC